MKSHDPDARVFQIPDEGVALKDIERSVIRATLKRTRGNQSQAARLLKIPRHVLLYRIKKLGL
jgi:two-component system NtrC family response regulator